MRHLHLLIATAGAVALGCGGDDGPNDPNDGGDDPNTVTVGNNVFTPASLTVPVNNTVTWQWNSGGTIHNVTFEDGVQSQNLGTGTFLRSFANAGAFPYQCTLHPGMTGTVTVSASTTGETGSGGTGGGDYP